jgi:hypothetical protein
VAYVSHQNFNGGHVMKRISVVFGTAALFLLFGTTAPAQAYQEDHPQESKPPENAKPPENSKPKPAENAKPPENGKPHDQATKPSDEAAKPAPTKPAPKDEKPAKEANAPKENRDTKTVKQSDTRTDTKSTVKHGPIENGRIPDAQFHAHFGREHTFHVGHPVVVEGQSRFQFGGYWFGFGEAWPVGWAYTDDVYVDFIDGQYFLIDPVHPGVQLALVVVV